jgi:hypothetical protein
MKTTQNNGQATATKANQERTTQYDEVTRTIRISFEHDGRMEPDMAREYVAARVIGYTDHTHTIDEGTRIMNVEDMGEPESERPTFAEAAREFIEMHYNHITDRDQIAAFMAEDISRAVADIYGKGNAARYLLDAISCRVQSWCNPALNDEE